MRIIIRRFPPRTISSNLVFASAGVMVVFLLFPLILSVFSTDKMFFADAFASNLVETPIGCMTDLSTDEVIMNEEVKPPEESDFPRMHLAVLDETQKPVEPSTRYSYDPSVSTIRIAFVNPYTTDEFNDELQFVMEIEGPTEDSRAAEFVAVVDGGSVGCDNHKRASGRLLTNQAAVVLKINDPTSKLRLWGGWATGHNAVRLTPSLVLEPGESNKADVEERIEELEEEIGEEEFRNSNEEKLIRAQDEEQLEQLLNDNDNEDEDEESPSASDSEDEEKDEDSFSSKEEWLKYKEDREKLDKLLNGDKAEEKEKGSLTGEAREATEKHLGLQRKRKNLLAKPDSVPEGLIDPSKRVNDLGLEIARKDKERGQPAESRRGISETKTIPQKLADKQLDLNSKKETATDRQKRRHKLTDHTIEHRKQRFDVPENLGLDDDQTDDDLPAVGGVDPGTDDVLPFEGDDGSKNDKQQKASDPSLQQQEQRRLEQSDHFLACAFFVASMTLFYTIFGKKRDKGRRDL